METVSGKIALVTGGGRGIGRSLALAFAARGNPVVVTGRTQSRLDQVAAEVDRLGGKALPLRCDVTRRPEVEALKNVIES